VETRLQAHSDQASTQLQPDEEWLTESQLRQLGVLLGHMSAEQRRPTSVRPGIERMPAACSGCNTCAIVTRDRTTKRRRACTNRKAEKEKKHSWLGCDSKRAKFSTAPSNREGDQTLKAHGFGPRPVKFCEPNVPKSLGSLCDPLR
jgi:hypothetical protein